MWDASEFLDLLCSTASSKSGIKYNRSDASEVANVVIHAAQSCFWDASNFG